MYGLSIDLHRLQPGGEGAERGVPVAGFLVKKHQLAIRAGGENKAIFKDQSVAPCSMHKGGPQRLIGLGEVEHLHVAVPAAQAQQITGKASAHAGGFSGPVHASFGVLAEVVDDDASHAVARSKQLVAILAP